ncbi:MAG: YchF/TatD family DNA exonuclease [bacterium]
MIDTHCHIQTEQFDSDREKAIADAMRAGVSHFIVPAIDFQSFDATLRIANEHENIFCGLGIHPHSAAEWNEGVRDRIMAEVETNKKIVAIGEIGLDYFYDFCPKDQQIKAFGEQIQLAQKLRKPIIIHTRDSIDETIEILGRYYKKSDNADNFGQFHCFSGTVEQMKRAVSLGFCVSYTGNITFKNSKLSDVVLETPDDRMLIETDSPYLAPVPYRGKRNMPEYVGLVAKKIAEIKKKDIQEIMTLTTQNAKRLFLPTLLAVLLMIVSSIAVTTIHAQVGGKPPDSVLTRDRREAEEIIKKQRDELLRAQEERRRDSIRTAQHEQEEQIRAAMEQNRRDSIRAVEKLADEERYRERLKTPIVWKAIGIGAGGGIGNVSAVTQLNRLSLAPTSVFASSFSIGTAITRGIDFDFSYSSFAFNDDLTRDGLYKSDLTAPPVGSLPPKHYLVPTHEEMATTFLDFDLRFVVNPRSPLKFYIGLGYLRTTIRNTQEYHTVDSSLTGAPPVIGANQTYKASFTRGGIMTLFGARYDFELGDNFILTPFAQIGAAFLFSGETPPQGFDFSTPDDPIVFTHLNLGVSLYFGWFTVARK